MLRCAVLGSAGLVRVGGREAGGLVVGPVRPAVTVDAGEAVAVGGAVALLVQGSIAITIATRETVTVGVRGAVALLVERADRKSVV